MGFTNIFESTAVIVAILGTVVSFLLSLSVKLKKVEIKALKDSSEMVRIEFAASGLAQKRDFAHEVRLDEIYLLLKAEEWRKSLYKYASASLTFSQFVVGGILASSFVADALSKTVIGILGLLVLASSLLNQHFRPAILHKAAAAKVYRLKTLRRWVEDKLYDITKGPVDEARINAVRTHVREVLDELDRSDLELLDSKNFEQKEKNS